MPRALEQSSRPPSNEKLVEYRGRLGPFHSSNELVESLGPVRQCAPRTARQFDQELLELHFQAQANRDASQIRRLHELLPTDGSAEG